MKELMIFWPSRDLHPNARVHFHRRAKAAKAARIEGKVMAMVAGWHNVTLPEGRLHLWIDFYPPDKRRRDDDGLLASFKPYRDGIADALKIDDKRFVSHPFVSDKPVKGGEVRVRITGGPEA